jgi:hypothetical protein
MPAPNAAKIARNLAGAVLPDQGQLVSIGSTTRQLRGSQTHFFRDFTTIALAQILRVN